MNHEFDPEVTEVADAELDRLVDGELPRERYRRLLTQLDADPEGWKRCALRFLEAQAWQSELCAATPPPAAAASASRRTGEVGERLARTCLALVAGYAIAFALGVAARNAWTELRGVTRTGHQPMTLTANSDPGVDADGTGEESADNPATYDIPERPWGHLTFVVDRGDGTNQEVELPVFRPDAAADNWLDRVRELPPRMVRDFQRRGYEVRRDVRWEPIELDRGLRIMVPLGEFEITPVSRVAY